MLLALGMRPVVPLSFESLKTPRVASLLLAAATLALFASAVGFDFINYDDNLYVFENVHVLRGLTWSGLGYAGTTLDGGSWMPVTWLSFMFDAAVFGSGPAGFHLTNVLLHAANAGLLLVALQRLTGRLWPAVVTAALFALHPQRSESVVWIAERKDVLSAFFWMLGLLAYESYARQPGPRRMMWVVFCLALGLMAKPMVVSFPLVLLLLDFWPLRRFGTPAAEWRAQVWPLVKEKIPLFLLCVATAAATIWSQGNQGAIVSIQFSWQEKLFRVMENVSFYCEKFFAPTDLAILYRVEALNYPVLAVVGLALVAVSGLALWRAGRWPWLVVGWFWFLIVLAPVAGFFRIGHITVADRYSYLPAVGLALATAFAVGHGAARWPRYRAVLASGLTGWIIFCALATWADLPGWRNTYAVFESAYRNSAHHIACDQLAAVCCERREYDQAISVCTRGLADNPRFISLYNSRGGAYYALGDLDRALADFDRAVEINPAFSATYYNRALVHLQRGRLAEARADAAKCIATGGQPDATLRQILAPPASARPAN